VATSSNVKNITCLFLSGILEPFGSMQSRQLTRKPCGGRGFFREYGGGPQNSPIRATRRLRAVSLGLIEINSPADKDCDDVAAGIFEA